MTVQELINKLLEVEDKGAEVFVPFFDGGYFGTDIKFQVENKELYMEAE